MTRLCETCREQRPLREYDLGGGQLSVTCHGCADERLRTEDHRARSQRRARIAELERHRRELIAALVKVDAEIADFRARPTPTRITLDDGGEVDVAFADGCGIADPIRRRARIADLERHRRELIASLVKVDAEIADLRARPTLPRIVLDDGGEVDDASFDDAFGFDLGDRVGEMS